MRFPELVGVKMEARVGIQYLDNHVLFKINKSKSLQDNIDVICEEISLKTSDNYGLKFNYTGNTNGANFENYVTEDNFGEIQDGYTLKLVPNLDLVIDQIFEKMLEDRQRSFNDLYNLSTDPGFIKAIVRKQRHIDVLQWLNDKYLSGKELSACLMTLLHLLKMRYIDDIMSSIVENIIRCVKNHSPPTPPTQLQSALAVLCQILYLKGHDLNKQLIIAELTISDLIPFIWSEDHSNLQLNTLMLINAMVKCVKGEKRIHFVKELNKRKNRNYIFKNILQSTRLSDAMAHELYVYQTYVLSSYSEALNIFIDTKTSSNLKDMEHSEDNTSRCSAFMEFEYSRSRSNSVNTILEENEGIRISFASVESEKSYNLETPPDRDSNPLLEEQICQLTNDCLLHYKKYHHKNFCQSRIEENTYKPGISITSERVVRMLAKLLHIGKAPVRTGNLYHPLVFNGDLKLPFLMELFSRTMWLLSKTRKEMKAYAVEDYTNLLVVVEKQINMVLEEKPMDYNGLTTKMMMITYEEVDKMWQKEKAAEWKLLYEKNPSVQMLKQKFRPANEKLIFQQRIQLLQKGSAFPKLPEKKHKAHHICMKLSENNQTIMWGDCIDTQSLYDQQFKVAEIKHLIVGKACPHVKDHSIKTPERALTLILEDGTVINLLARDNKHANIWIDGFSLLLGKKHRSEDYTKEMETLMEMDCALHLLELQNVRIPNVAPEIPPLPTQLCPKPALPPKSPKITKRRTLTALHINPKNIFDGI